MNVSLLFRDPRHYQILSLAALLIYGVTMLNFAIEPAISAAMLATALVTQLLFTRFLALGRFDPRSPLISGLSLCLLLKTNSLWLAAIAAFITIASKFLIRARGKHIFNPTNFGIVSMILLSGAVWVSPGQWGGTAWFGFLLVCLGGLVVNRAKRSDVTLAFLAFHLSIIFGRALWLGDPLAIPFHQLQNGAILIFAFFMISDPKTTPNTRAGRIIFALLVALGAAYIQFVLFRPNGVLYSLVLCSLAVPLIDRLLPGRIYQWNQAPTHPLQGASNEASSHPAYTGGHPLPQPVR